MINSKTIRLAGHVVLIGEEYIQEFGGKNLKERSH
jgi:hypothetical protein